MKLTDNKTIAYFLSHSHNLFLAGIFAVILAVLSLSYFEHSLFTFFVMGIIFVLISLCISKKYLDVALYCLLVWIALEPFILKFVPDSLFVFLKYGPELFIYVLLAIVIGKDIIKKKKIQFITTPINGLLIVFIFVAIISMILNGVSAYVGILGIRQIIRFIFLFYLILYSNLSKEKIKNILFVLLSLVVFECIVAVIQFATYGAIDQFLLPDMSFTIGTDIFLDGVEQFWEVGQRVFATFGRYDKLGSFLSLAFIGLLAFLLEKKFDRRKKIILLLILALIGFSILLTYSRACWLATLVGSVVIGVIIKKNKKFIIVLAAMFVALLLYSGYYVVTTQTNVAVITDFPQLSIMERFLQMFSRANFASSYEGLGRVYFVVNTPVKVAANYPVFGVGPGQYGGGVAAALGNKTKYYELGLPFGVYGEIGQIDNNWFSIWGETGTLGLVIFTLIFIQLYRGARKIFNFTKDTLLKTLSLALQGMIISVAILGFFGPYFELRTLMFYFWLIAGLTYYLYHRELQRYKIH